MRWAMLAVLAMLETGAAHAQDLPSDLSSDQIDEIVLCSASFEVRADLMRDWKANSEAIRNERAAAYFFADYVARHSRVAQFDTGRRLAKDLVLKFYARDITYDVENTKPVLLELYRSMGATGAFPPTCMEDEICIHCKNLLRTYQRLDGTTAAAH